MTLLWVAVCVAIVLAGCGAVLLSIVWLLRRVCSAITRRSATFVMPQPAGVKPDLKIRGPLSVSASHD